MKSVLIFDADNTIWDTDAVFRGAQLALLNILAKAKLITQPSSQLETLRIIDQALMSDLRQAEYNFKLLSTALVYLYSQKLTVEETVNTITAHKLLLSDPNLAEIADEAHQSFKKELERIPPLYPDTIPVLFAIRASATETNPIIMILLSEGDYTRLERILEAYKIRKRGFFDEIILAPKSKEAFERAKEIGQKRLHKASDNEDTVFVLIGDALHRDIKLGNQAGFITVYKPSGFKGVETPNTPDEQPDYTIKNLGELPPILRHDLGLPIRSLV